MDDINVIVIIIDTLRRDYGLLLRDLLEQWGFIYYDNAISTSSWTLPSHVSLFTGLYPAFHGVHGGRHKDVTSLKIRKSLPLLSRDLLERDYRTILVSANPFITPNFGFEDFEEFYTIYRTLGWLTEKEKYKLNKIKLKHEVQSRLDLTRALLSSGNVWILFKLAISYFFNNIGIIDRDWPLDKGAKKALSVLKSLILSHSNSSPNFIFVNLMEVHEPYLKNDPFNKVRKSNLKSNTGIPKDYLTLWKEAYEREVLYERKILRKILQILRDRKALESSLIIITSDHGQLLGEYNRIGHGVFLYDELIRVPLFIRYPTKWVDVEFDKESRVDLTKYISLSSLRKLILESVDHGHVNESALFSETVFAENYGSSIKEPPRNDEEVRNLEMLDKYRIAVYYRGFKGIFNVNDWKFENVTSLISSDTNDDEALKRMRKSVLNFLKLSTANKKLKLIQR